MIPDYHYRADQPDPATTRLLHVLFYAAAALLLVAGVHSLYVYVTGWTAGDDYSHLWQLLLAILYLLAAGAVAYATYNHGGGKEAAPERYVDVAAGTMTYALDQLAGKQRVDLTQLAQVTRPSVRELILEFRDGRQVILPVYLIEGEEKQRELEALLQNAARA
ncbi:hypothetical protein [Lewinella sp. IMCC34183]|uniref:hypothetical protein n=1 Tax=Lewinella sp. IMCC34183 TaxID=2248762 RepID=UPI000E26DA08|nr:hypothetical protein [Lewinella sp. IMCC34183]